MEPRRHADQGNDRNSIMLQLQANSGVVEINGIRYTEVRLGNFSYPNTAALGFGSGGTVELVQFREHRMAVKEMVISDSDLLTNRRAICDVETLRRINNNTDDLFVKYYGYILNAEKIYLCMELMDASLERLLSRQNEPFPEDIIGKIALNVTRAISVLQTEYQLIHRDVCPENILMNSRGQIKICDFGIVSEVVGSRVISTTKGRQMYLAPERFNNTPYNTRADAWSLGITLMHLAEGIHPYLRNINGRISDIQVQLAIMNSDPPRLLNSENFSREFSAFIESCLKKDPNRRPRFSEMLEMPFLQQAEASNVDVATWVQNRLGVH